MRKLLGLCVALFISSYAFSGQVVIESFEGMDPDESALLISETKSPDMSNTDLSQDGLSLKRRKGQAQLFDISITTYSAKSFGTLKNSSYDLLLVGYANVVETVDKAYTKSIIHSTATIGYTWDFVQHQETVYATNGKDDVFSFDGVSTTSILSAPKGTSIAIYNDTFFISNHSGNKANIQQSAYGAPTNWTTDTGATDGRSFDVADYGDQVVDLEVNGGVLGILCSNSLLKLSGTQNPYQVIEVDKNIGCKSKGSVTTYRGLTYFLGSDGQYYTTNFVSVESISEDEFFSAFDNSGLAQRVSNFRTKSTEFDFSSGISSHTSTSISPGNVVLSTGTTVYTSEADWNAFTTIGVDTDTISGSVILSSSGFFDSFDDLDYTNDPTWTVSAGSWDASLGFLRPTTVDNNVIVTPLSSTLVGKSTITISFITKAVGGSPITVLDVYVYRNSAGSNYFALHWNDVGKVTIETPNGESSEASSDPFSGPLNFTAVQTDEDTYQLYEDGVLILTYNDSSAQTIPSSPLFQLEADGTIVIDDFGSYTSNGLITSPIIDTTFDTPVWGTIVGSSSTPSSTEIGYYARSSTDSAMGDDPTWVAQTNEAQVTGIDNKRYIQLKSTFTTTFSSATPQLDDLTLIYSVTGYYITSEVVIAEINTWGLFEVDEELNGGSMIYSITSTNTVQSDSNLQDGSVAWTVQPNNAIVVVATNTYVYVKSTFTITNGTQTPTIKAITLNWNSGSNTSEDMTAQWFDDRLYVGVMKSSSSSSNDAIFVFDPSIGIRGAWWKYLTGVNPSVFTDWDGKFLIASSTSAVVAEFLTGDTDLGENIDAYYFTKKLFVPTLYQPDSYSILSLAYDVQDSGNLLVDYYLNGASTSENQYKRDMTNGTDIIFENFKFPQATNAHYIQFRISNDSGSFFNFYSLQALTEDLPFRIQLQ